MAKVKKPPLLDHVCINPANEVGNAKTEIAFLDAVERAIRKHAPVLADWEPVFGQQPLARNSDNSQTAFR